MHTLNVPWTHHVPHQNCSTSSGLILHPTATTHPPRDRFPSVADTYLLPVPMRHGETKRGEPPEARGACPTQEPPQGHSLGVPPPPAAPTTPGHLPVSPGPAALTCL